MSESEKLRFETPVILMGGGHVEEGHFADLLARGYPVIAADGAADRFRDTDIMPHAIIGDMDSVSDIAHWQQKTKVIALQEQDSTDFEKCLYSTDAPLYYGLGLLGRRFDHSLAAMHVLAKYADDKNVLLLDETDLIFATTGTVKLNLNAGDRLSVFPFSPVTFDFSTGLKYPLDGLTMEQGRAIGTSNQAIGGQVEIAPVQGNESVFAVMTEVANYTRLHDPATGSASTF